MRADCDEDWREIEVRFGIAVGAEAVGSKVADCGTVGDRREAFKSSVSTLSSEFGESVELMVSPDSTLSFKAMRVFGIAGFELGAASFEVLELEWDSESIRLTLGVVDDPAMAGIVFVVVVLVDFVVVRVGWVKSFHFRHPSKSIRACIQPHSMTLRSNQTKLTG